MARISHRTKCLLLTTVVAVATGYLAWVTIQTLSQSFLISSMWEGVENTGEHCECQTSAAIAMQNSSKVLPKSLCGPTADLRGPGTLIISLDVSLSWHTF